jgi:ankyrin repeat domain-containing protein 50
VLKNKIKKFIFAVLLIVTVQMHSFLNAQELDDNNDLYENFKNAPGTAAVEKTLFKYVPSDRSYPDHINFFHDFANTKHKEGWDLQRDVLFLSAPNFREENKEPMNEADKSGYTPLTRAINNNFYTETKELIRMGAEINKPDYTPQRLTPLAKTIVEKKYPLFALLLNSGADPYAKGGWGMTALHWLATLSEVSETDRNRINQYISAFKNRKINFNVKDNFGRTPLHIAVLENKIYIANVLAKKYSPLLNIQDIDGDTPLTYAVLRNNPSLIGVMLNMEASCNAGLDSKNPPLIAAIEKANVEAVRELLSVCGNKLTNQPGKDGIMPLDLAVETGNVELVNLLLQNSATIESHDI